MSWGLEPATVEHTTYSADEPDPRIPVTMTIQTPCQADPELWFSTDPDDQYEAIAACGFCPIRTECANYGSDEIAGVWGGVLHGRSHNTVVQPFKRDCGICGNEFTARTSVVVYCSNRCQKEGKLRKEAERVRTPYQPNPDLPGQKCDHGPCGEAFQPVRRGQLFCSERCRDRARKARARLLALAS